MEGVGSGTLLFVLGVVFTIAGWDVALLGWVLMVSGAAVVAWGLVVGASSDREGRRSPDVEDQLHTWGYRRRPRQRSDWH